MWRLSQSDGSGNEESDTDRHRVLGLRVSRRGSRPLLASVRVMQKSMSSTDDLSTGSLRATPDAESPFAHPDRAAFEAHLARKSYGPFTLTEAVRPGWHAGIVPREGYRFDTYADPHTRARLPAIIAAVSRETLFETFIELLAPLGESCEVVLESSHEKRGPERPEYVRESIERLVLESLLWDFEDLLTDDGCTGIAIMHPHLPMEVQLDEHKLLVVYAPSRAPFAERLEACGVGRNDELRVISQGEHLHTSHSRYTRDFNRLRHRLGAE